LDQPDTLGPQGHLELPDHLVTLVSLDSQDPMAQTDSRARLVPLEQLAQQDLLVITVRTVLQGQPAQLVWQVTRAMRVPTDPTAHVEAPEFLARQELVVRAVHLDPRASVAPLVAQGLREQSAVRELREQLVEQDLGETPARPVMWETRVRRARSVSRASGVSRV
jgi:hypothetical protein